jgi:serine/threonine protein kinase
MPLAGDRLGPYEILEAIGAGGMGEVWKAHDSRLGRVVAIKLLKGHRSARFEQEARAIAALNHPHICQLYDIGADYLVMEYVDGKPLSGPLSVDESVRLVVEIASALAEAHNHGVLHRDIKPNNIVVTAKGDAKLLDFGIAKLMSNDPDVTRTMDGVLVGTPAYMSPEQARGEEVDARADIWAFGVVLHEMLTGRALFAGLTISDTLASVLKTEPDLTAIPSHLLPALERCLRKDPRRRWRNIADVQMAIEAAPSAAASTASSHRKGAWAITAALMVLAASGWYTAWRGRPPGDRPLIRLNVDLGPQAIAGLNRTASISPDGRRLVFAAQGPDGNPQLATRLLDQSQVMLLSGTENGRDPFFQPDGQWIGFFAGNQLKKISVRGGAPVTLAGGQTMQGGDWGGDGNIIASLGNALPLTRLSSGGGKAQMITKLAVGESTHRWPQILPGGEAVLYTASPSPTGMDMANIEAISLQTGQVKILQHGGYYARYLPSGHMVYVHQGVLLGVKFDPVRLEMHGAPLPLLDDLAANPITGGGQFDFSNTGTFIYAAGKSATLSLQLAWLDSSSRLQPVMAASGVYSSPRISPDGRKLALLGNGADVYIHDLEKDTTTQLTFAGGCNWPIWSPDSRHIAFGTPSSIFWMRSDGAGDPQRLLDSPRLPRPWSISPSGRLAYFERGPDTGFDIWTISLDLTDPDHPKTGQPEPFLRTPADEMVPRISPDGRWVAYRSNETGIPEIYVRPFPSAVGGKWKISTGGGFYAFWSNNGRELFYETTDERIMSVNYKVEADSFVAGKPRLWSGAQLFFIGSSNLDLAPDGKRFVVFSAPESPAGQKSSVQVTMLLNFFDELKRRIP